MGVGWGQLIGALVWLKVKQYHLSFLTFLHKHNFPAVFATVKRLKRTVVDHDFAGQAPGPSEDTETPKFGSANFLFWIYPY